MTEISSSLNPVDVLAADVLTDDVSDNYVSKTLFAVSEFANVVRAGAKVLSGETLLCGNLGYGLRLVSQIGDVRHTLLFDTGPEGAIFIRNCANLGIPMGEVECIAVTHGHWDHMAALPAAIDAIRQGGGRVAVHVNPGMFNERGIRLRSGGVIPAAKVPSVTELEQHGAAVVNSPEERLASGDHLRSIEKKIRCIKNGVRILRTTHCRVPLPLILSVGEFQSERFCSADQTDYNHTHLADDGFDTLSFEADRPFAAEKFQHFLEWLPHNIFRAKGLIRVDEGKKPYIFHLVGQRFTLDESDRIGAVKNRLVLIGRNLDRQQLLRRLQGCLVG